MTSLEQAVRYHDGIEQAQENEAATIERIVASMGRVNRAVCDRHRHGLRDAHAKSHGILKGTLRVYDNLPAPLRQGVFADPASYPVVLRLSTAPGDIHSDTVPAPRGVALKLLGVPGRQLGAGRQLASTQDFLLVNHPVIAFGHAAAYLATQKLLEQHDGDPQLVRQATATLAHGASTLLHAVGVASPVLDTLGAPNTHILGETFYSMAALRHGDYVAKVCLVPLSENVRALTGQALRDGAGHSELRDLVVDFFSREGADYELRVQLCTDLRRMPVEDASVRWPEDESPYLPVARLSIAPQPAYSPARRIFADDVLSFNPWHCVEAHRPLGSIMRARIRAYEASSAFRHAMNQQPRIEINHLDQVPD